MTRQFFRPVPSTFTQPKGLVLSDQDLLRAWQGVPDDQVLTAPAHTYKPTDGVEREHTRGVRLRVLDLRARLREAAE